jgi:hypothetical protein
VVRIGSVRPPPVRALPGASSAFTTGGCLRAQRRRVLPCGRPLEVLMHGSGENRESGRPDLPQPVAVRVRLGSPDTSKSGHWKASVFMGEG